MELKHYLNDILIDEPIGFDKFKTKMKRGKYHGMSIEASVGELEFYGRGAEMIVDAYNKNVDSEMNYRVELNGEDIYLAMCDLSTIKIHSGEYCSVSCSMGDIGVKTAFNNNSDIEINLNSTKDIDGVELATDYPFPKMTLPRRTITYTNRMQQNETEVIEGTQNNGITYKDDVPVCFLNLRFNGTNICEFDNFEPNLYCPGKNAPLLEEEGNPFSLAFDLHGYAEPLFGKAVDFESKFGEASLNIKVKAKVSVKLNGAFFTNMVGDTQSVTFTPMLVESNCLTINDNNYLWKGNSQFLTFGESAINDTTLTFDINIDKDINVNSLFFGIRIKHNNMTSGGKYYNNETPIIVTLEKGSFVELKLNSEVTLDTDAKMVFVGDALQKCVDVLSSQKLTLKSEFYGSPWATKNQQTAIGGGWAKVLTNGYFIRNIENKEFVVSFKDFIESLSMQDCVGWAFEGDNVVRVEPWKYFYNNDIILNINNPKEKNISIDNDYVCSVLNIGYKKYEDNEDIKAMDSIHGERIYTSNTKAISKEIKAQSAFIADNYAIELTRRAKFNTDKEDEYKYDENIFVISVDVYEDEFNAEATSDLDSTTVENVNKETYNVKLSPAQCALRWLDFLFAVNGQNIFRFTSGKLNCDAKALPRKSETLLSDNTPTNDFRENSDLLLEWATPLLKAESLKITYPLTFSEYHKIVSNPYGIVVVDGDEYWIKEFEYSLSDGECSFSLTPKF
jgi:hypothetical protein